MYPYKYEHDGLTGTQRQAKRFAAAVAAQPLRPDRLTRQRYRLQARELAKGTYGNDYGTREYTPSPLTAREHYQALTAPPEPVAAIKPKRAPRKKKAVTT